MCGIIGFNWEDDVLLRKASRDLRHRGPDNSGKFVDKGVTLGHRRLSIVDLSKSGKQPMSNEEGTVWITFNGEIYNFKGLRKDLKKKHDFKSDTDTEILVHLYEEEGFGMLEKLQGMFAFCIYDSKKEIFFIARDRCGIKPLYYYEKNKKLIFASEIKAILNHEIKREVNRDAIRSYLTFRANSLNETVFKGIKKLMPGHYLVYDLKKKKSLINRYWEVEYKPENGGKNFFSKKLRELMQDSVKSRLISDVPYGAYLSGGVDSGAVVSLMKKYSFNPINTFSVGFEEERHSESEEAKFLAEKLGTNHHELTIGRNAIKHLPDIIYHSDEPMADPTAIPIYLLSKYTKKYCTVVLTGEGSDELFLGYPQYKFMKMHNSIIKKVPRIARRAIPLGIRSVPTWLLNKGFKFASSLGEKGIDRFSDFLEAKRQSKQYFSMISIFNQEEQNQLLKEKMPLYSKYDDYFGGGNLISSCQKIDFENPMVDDLLMKVDKNTMAFGVEGRVPFLDHRVVEFSSTIPLNLRLRGFSKDKFILRESVKDLMPKQTSRRKKKHFFVPIDNWFDKELRDIKKEFLDSKFIRKQGIFDNIYIDKIIRGFDRSKLFYSRQLWSLITFQIWYKQYIENERVKI